MATRPKYSRAKRVQMERKSGQILNATRKSKSKVTRNAGYSTAQALVRESMSTVKVKKPKKAVAGGGNTSKRLKSRAKATQALLKG